MSSQLNRPPAGRLPALRRPRLPRREDALQERGELPCGPVAAKEYHIINYGYVE